MGAALALVGVVALGQCAYVYGTGSERDITVNRLDHKIYGSGDDVQDKYLVFTDQGVFENTDSVLRLKFDSSDLQNLLREGENYRIETYGWRIPVLSCYPNIVKTTPIENNVEKE